MNFQKEIMLEALEILPNIVDFVVEYDNNVVIESYKDGNELKSILDLNRLTTKIKKY